MNEFEITRVGIIGDGQLGRMMAEANRNAGLSLEIGVLGVESPDGRRSPAAQIPGVKQFEGSSLYDGHAIRQLVEWADVTTIEVEHVGTDTMIELDNGDNNFQPNPRTIKTIQNKFEQKKYLESRGIAVGDFLAFTGRAGLEAVRDEFGESVMIKSAVGAFDGRMNLLLEPGMDWEEVEQQFGLFNENLYAERLVPFVRELSLVGVKNYKGQITPYPLVQTIHKNNICHSVYAPAPVSPAVERRAVALGIKTMKCFEGAGVMAVEMFETAEGEVLVNEVAPRVHNSGHWTIEGAVTSQFENHLRAVANMPIGSTQMRDQIGAAVMINILGTGERTGELDDSLMSEIYVSGFVSAHNYGKTLRANRKVGHITGLGQNLRDALFNAEDGMDIVEGTY